MSRAVPSISRPQPHLTTSQVVTAVVPTEIGNLVIGNSKLIETITLPITIGNVVDSITEPEKTITITFYNDILIDNTKCNFVSNTKYCFIKLFILFESKISYNLNLKEFLIKFQKANVLNNNKQVILRFK